MINLEQIANSLGSAKKTAAGFICRCPCHEDKSASLSLKESSKGGLIINCFAGCNWEDIKKELVDRGLVRKSTKSNYDPYADARLFVYTDLSGNKISRTVKKPKPARPWQERFENGQWIKGLNKIFVPLYNLKAVTESEVVYLTEGEKDAETLIVAGLVGTTNNNGAGFWDKRNNEYLRNKIIVICQDNDPAGRERTKALAKGIGPVCKELRLFEPPNVPEKGDVTDWVQDGGNPADIFGMSIAIVRRLDEEDDKVKHATRNDYFELFERVLNNPRKCIFARKLMTFDEQDQIWNPCVNYLEILRSETAVMNEKKGGLKYSLAYVNAHFFAYEQTKEPEFLIDLPVWDGHDRISEMAYLLKLKPEFSVSDVSVSELLKEWCCRMFQRLYDPMIQNRILVLQGGQGIGKDTWTSMLVDGLGQFAVPLAVMKEDKDTYLNLHRGLCMKISEFDKTAKTEASILKDIITTPNTNLRAPYDKDSKVRVSRCSFISSANAEDLLRDHTGNRRFMIFELESIDYPYKDWSREQIKEWQLQVLAEAQYLANKNYTAGKEAQAQMKEYICNQTPTDPAQEIVAEFLHELFSQNLSLVGTTEISAVDPLVLKAKHELKRKLGGNVRSIALVLNRQLGKRKNVGGQRPLFYKLPPKETLQLETEFDKIQNQTLIGYGENDEF